MKTNENSYSQLCCDITVEFNIAGTPSSFSFILFENQIWALFVNDSAVKLSKQRTKLLLIRSGSSFKNKVNSLFPNVWIRRKVM